MIINKSKTVNCQRCGKETTILIQSKSEYCPDCKKGNFMYMLDVKAQNEAAENYLKPKQEGERGITITKIERP